MENLKYWNLLKQVPERAKKIIQHGRLKGYTDISPQWRLEIMSEVFGPVGKGWYYEIMKQWTEPASEGQIVAFTNINLYVKINDEWSKPIFGTGGNMLIKKEKGGLYTNDEAFKMALTDALSVAMKCVGVAADVYNGFASSKYDKPEPVTLPELNDERFLKAKMAVEKGEYDKVDLLSNFNLTDEQKNQLKHL